MSFPLTQIPLVSKPQTDTGVRGRRLRRSLASLSTRRPGFNGRSAHVGFMVDKVAVGHICLREFRVSPAIIFPLLFLIRPFHLPPTLYNLSNWQRLLKAHSRRHMRHQLRALTAYHQQKPRCAHYSQCSFCLPA